MPWALLVRELCPTRGLTWAFQRVGAPNPVHGEPGCGSAARGEEGRVRGRPSSSGICAGPCGAGRRVDWDGRHFDGWFPSAPSDPAVWGARWDRVRAFAKDAGRDVEDVTGALYVTISFDDDASKASDRLNDYLQRYYNRPATTIRSEQACYAGSLDGASAWLRSYIDSGAHHFVVRRPGEHARNMDRLAALRERLVA